MNETYWYIEDDATEVTPEMWAFLKKRVVDKMSVTKCHKMIRVIR
jgi:hypothetical protein